MACGGDSAPPGRVCGVQADLRGRSTLSEKKFTKGDKVKWQSHGQTVEGEVERKITSDTEEAGRTVRASKDDPQYQVRSDKTGKDAVHKPDALRRGES